MTTDPSISFEIATSVEISAPPDAGGLRLRFKTNDGAEFSVQLNAVQANHLLFEGPQFLADYEVAPEGDSCIVSVGGVLGGTRVKLPSSPLIIPHRYASPIGRILATWGQFDSKFDEFHDALMKANGTDPHTKPSQFERRRKHLLRLASDSFGKSSLLYQHLRRVAQMAKALAIPRNLIAHGHYSLRVQMKREPPSPMIVTVKLHASGKNGPLELDYDELETLYREFAHLTGLIGQLVRPDSGLPLPSSDILLLQDFLRSNLPPPTPSRIERQPRSSPS